MDPKQLILIANPGSSSRRYAVYEGTTLRGRLHIEQSDDTPLDTVASTIKSILVEKQLLAEGEQISAIGLRVVAPATNFTEHHELDERMIEKLRTLNEYAPLHITATLSELDQLAQQFSGVPIIGVSDSAFHAQKPLVAQYYGLPLDDAKSHDIRRFGYHGISCSSVVRSLRESGELPSRLVICHLGSGASITAVKDGQSIDTTMGYSPLEGVLMATRSGSLDPVAANVLKNKLQLNDQEFESYLNAKCGLLGISGTSSDIRELLKHESTNERAALALEMYVYHVRQAISAMAAALGGIDALVFAGTVGERSTIMRERIVAGLGFLGLQIDSAKNADCNEPEAPMQISKTDKTPSIIVTPSLEDQEMVRVTLTSNL
jgi:acetate kinase